MLEPRYQLMLVNAVDHDRIKNQDYSSINPKLEEAIALVKSQCPEKFHSDETMRSRIFYDEPAAQKIPVHHSGFLRPLQRVNRY
jgi:hypothetical protein